MYTFDLRGSRFFHFVCATRGSLKSRLLTLLPSSAVAERVFQAVPGTAKCGRYCTKVQQSLWFTPWRHRFIHIDILFCKQCNRIQFYWMIKKNWYSRWQQTLIYVFASFKVRERVMAFRESSLAIQKLYKIMNVAETFSYWRLFNAGQATEKRCKLNATSQKQILDVNGKISYIMAMPFIRKKSFQSIW